VAASLLGCYLAGMASTGFWRPSGNTCLRPSTQPAAAVVVAQLPPKVTKVDRMEALRREADRRLLQFGDVELALSSYKRILDMTPAEQRAISPGRDSWLMMALKDARSKEMKHARIKKN
jgi:hypothetical protein